MFEHGNLHSEEIVKEPQREGASPSISDEVSGILPCFKIHVCHGSMTNHDGFSRLVYGDSLRTLGDAPVTRVLHEPELARNGERGVRSSGIQRQSGVKRWAYAQVAVEGRRLDDVQGDRDILRPFAVKGAFDDMELISLIRFIRSRPISPISNELGASKPVSGDKPVSRVVRTETLPRTLTAPGLLSRLETSRRRFIEDRIERPNPNGYVVVWIDLAPFTSEEVILERTGNDWVVVSAVWGVA